MATLKERHEMIIRALNDPDRPMSAISGDKLQFLGDTIGWDQLASDTKYLIAAGLVDRDAIRFGIDGGYVFMGDCMALTAKGFDYANIDTVGSDVNAVTIKIHKNTIEQIESIINAINIPESEKKTLMQLVKEKGAESVVSKCVDILFSNAGAATHVLSELAKSAF